ncbi:MAG: PEP-utilizing enzyme [Alphaproteobacteria bacterium]|nr:PEP-utilizing enzyme [Alphaproteobacteria bacterium]
MTDRTLQFSTKAGTLERLRGRVTGGQIAPLIRFTVERWYSEMEACVSDVVDVLGAGPWIVRSSCLNEDTWSSSNAGAFLSVKDVDRADLKSSVEAVIASYSSAQPLDEVLVQPMLRDVIRSGVALSHDINTRAPYRVVNWSEGSATDTITGGGTGRIWQQAALSPVAPPDELNSILGLLDELLALFNGAPIDCEFAVTRDCDGGEQLWLLQARPLLVGKRVQSEQEQARRLSTIQRQVARGMRDHPFLKGRRSVYGVMPDWNPAEIIGIRPRPLALSLYRDLITDSIWAYQRHNYGYRNLRSFPLMPHFFGLPYIDVRLSFNSFIPADLDDGLAGRLVDHYIDRLLAEPMLHDKVEFDIVFSCYTLDLPSRLERLRAAGFSGAETEILSNSLRRLTNRIADPKTGLWRTDAAKLEQLTARREALQASSSDPLERIYWLLEDGKRYGTLPFAGLARAGFIAVQMLSSMVAVGALSTGDYDAFMSSVSTVGGQLTRDRAMLDRTTFLARYGHLRPGTYDITSPRYDDSPDLYFDWSTKARHGQEAPPFSMTLPQMREIARLQDLHGLHADPVGLFDFLQAGIELRELAKFQFSRNLSDALSLVAEFGNEYGFNHEDMAYCDIGILRELHMGAADPRSTLARAIDCGRDRYAETQSLSLPPVIATPEDVWGFEWPASAPNFVTQKNVVAPVVVCESGEPVAGKIVCIPNADPGFDWLFSHQIAGLVTAWGGANSHMAIRAGELGLPAVIGAGEMLYRQWSAASHIHIDCGTRRVEVLA